jgi:hypothetical protein
VRGTFASAEGAQRVTIFSHRIHEKNIRPIRLDDNHPSNRFQLAYSSRPTAHARNFFAIFWRQ